MPSLSWTKLMENKLAEIIRETDVTRKIASEVDKTWKGRPTHTHTDYYAIKGVLDVIFTTMKHDIDVVGFGHTGYNDSPHLWK